MKNEPPKASMATTLADILRYDSTDNVLTWSDRPDNNEKKTADAKRGKKITVVRNLTAATKCYETRMRRRKYTKLLYFNRGKNASTHINERLSSFSPVPLLPASPSSITVPSSLQHVIGEDSS